MNQWYSGGSQKQIISLEIHTLDENENQVKTFTFIFCFTSPLENKTLFKEELSKKTVFWNYLKKTYFWPWIKIFRLHLKIHMLMSWRPTSNNSYRAFKNSRLTFYLNPQIGIWKRVINTTVRFALFLFYSLAVTFIVNSMLLSNSKR